ncbi:hypothetical protein P3T23_008622, partial [Paraburkholderia sp. GAS448]
MLFALQAAGFAGCWLWWRESLMIHPSGGLRKFFGFGLVPFLDLLVVYWRRPCAGRHLLFFVLPKKSRQKKGAEDASFPDVS